MIYKVRGEGIISKLILNVYIFSIVILINIMGISKPFLYYVIATLCTFLIITFISNVELTVDASFLEVKRPLFRKKRLDPEQIKEIKFILVGWKGKGAIIKLNKGLSLSITKYSPNIVIEDLLAFADKNNIPIKKTKDFMVLEKWNM